MKEVTEWWGEIGGAERHWLILGKGPSFAQRDRHDLTPYTTIGINHVAREMPVFAASAVNYDVLRDCGEAIYRNSRYLLMPRWPHTIPGEAPYPLEAYFETFPVLEKLDAEGRLVWYNVSSDPVAAGSPVIENGPFSVCILFNLLGTLGARHLRTLGVDGGRAYAAAFSDIVESTRLANGMASYDFQFQEMIAAVQRFGMDYAALGAVTPWQRVRMVLKTPASTRALRRWLAHAPVLTRRTPGGVLRGA